ncbi:hypothetical protein BDV95DRAFT_316399 [Massariosphaeria phaeospora]|uniref:RING-type domain-containing protein n=1 Tax=Massariosphaeria phaeospora TaxID=100035 RepID=A0A7C8MF38_9PLEO|nr:hypothetical protein BDV95DRAFT_316399 [Massariosphaeria phaeospora]
MDQILIRPVLPSKAEYLGTLISAHPPADDPRCPICFDDWDHQRQFIVRIRECQHTFHYTCLLDWFNSSTTDQSNTCPNCRTKLFRPVEGVDSELHEALFLHLETAFEHTLSGTVIAELPRYPEGILQAMKRAVDHTMAYIDVEVMTMNMARMSLADAEDRSRARLPLSDAASEVFLMGLFMDLDFDGNLTTDQFVEMTKARRLHFDQAAAAGKLDGLCDIRFLEDFDVAVHSFGLIVADENGSRVECRLEVAEVNPRGEVVSFVPDVEEDYSWRMSNFMMVNIDKEWDSETETNFYSVSITEECPGALEAVTDDPTSHILTLQDTAGNQLLIRTLLVDEDRADDPRMSLD